MARSRPATMTRAALLLLPPPPLLLLLLALLAGAASAESASDWSAPCKQSGCQCSWIGGKKTAKCASSGLTTVPDKLNDAVQVLDLRGNALSVLGAGAFSSVGLVNLHQLLLRNCSLRSLHKEALRNLTIMVVLDLSYNALTELDAETFAYNAKLRFLYLSGNPLAKLRAHQFPKLADLRLLELIQCDLEAIDKKAFINLNKLETLKLGDNRLTNLKSDVLQPFNNLKSLDLQGNPWVCDCRLLALREYLSEANLNSTLTLCESPEHLTGRSWSRLHKEDFACKPSVQMIDPDVEGRPGFDVTFSCRVSGSPAPQIWWSLQDRQLLNVTTADSLTEHLLLSQDAVATPNVHDGDLVVAWSNLTLRRIGEQDAGQYRCVARNGAGRVEANATLVMPAKPVIVIVEEQVGVPHAVVIGVAALVALLLLLSLCLLTVCLCRRHRKRQQRRASHASIGVKLNGHGPHNGPGGDLCGGTGLDGSGGGSGADHCGADKSLLAGDLDSNGDFPIKQSQTHVCAVKSADGSAIYEAVSQSDGCGGDPSAMMSLMTLAGQRVRDSLTYIPGEKYDERVPEPAYRLMLSSSAKGATIVTANGQQVCDLSTGSPIQLSDGSFYPDLLDIPHRGRGGGSPSGSGMSASSTVPDTSRLTLPLNAAHLAGHPSYASQGSGQQQAPAVPEAYRVVPLAAIQPPVQFTDGAVLLVPAGSGGAPRPGYVTLPRRPRPRMPGWGSTSTPPVSSASPVPSLDRQTSTPGSASQQQPIYDTIGPRVTADGSSSSALSLNKIAGLNADNARQHHTLTLDRVHKMSLPAYYMPIAEVDVPPASPTTSQRATAYTANSTPNILEAMSSSMHHQQHHHMQHPYQHPLNYNNNSIHQHQFHSPGRRVDGIGGGGGDDCGAASPLTTSTPNGGVGHSGLTSTHTETPEILSPIADFRTPGSRASVSSVASAASGVRRKIPPMVAPKPAASTGARRVSSVATPMSNGHGRRDSVASDAVSEYLNGSMERETALTSPLKVAPKPPPKPSKRLSVASSTANGGGDARDAAFEDEGEDGTEV